MLGANTPPHGIAQQKIPWHVTSEQQLFRSFDIQKQVIYRYISTQQESFMFSLSRVLGITH